VKNGPNLLCAAMLALLGASRLVAGPPQKPVLVVFNFESKFDRGKEGKKFATSVRKKAERLLSFVSIEKMTVDEVVESTGFKARFDTPVAEVVKITREGFGADLAVWGKVERQGGGFRIRARALDLRHSSTKLRLDEVYTAPGRQRVRFAAEKIVNALSEGKKIEDTGKHETEADVGGPDPGLSRPNLVKNGDFEEGGESPKHWQRINNLTTFWDSTASPTGKCLRTDTDVLDTEVKAWEGKLGRGARLSNAPRKTVPTMAQQYKTIGAGHGVHFYSAPITVKPGMTYRISFDLKGRWGGMFFPKIFVKGYAGFKDKAFGDQDREIYRQYKAGRTETQGKKFEHFTRTFRPTDTMVVFDFESQFDQGRTGARVAKILRERLGKRHPMIERERMDQALRETTWFRPTFDLLIDNLQDFAFKKLTADISVWGRVEEADGGLRIGVRATNLRKKQTRPFVDMTEDCPSPDDVSKFVAKVATETTKNALIVKWMRIDLYTYWPRGTYYFDNVRITEEGYVARTMGP